MGKGKICNTCKYRMKFDAKTFCCNYLTIVGTMRPCEATYTECNMYKRGEMKKVEFQMPRISLQDGLSNF